MAIYNLEYINEFLFKKKEIQKINYDSFIKQDLLKIQNIIKSIIFYFKILIFKNHYLSINNE